MKEWRWRLNSSIRDLDSVDMSENSHVQYLGVFFPPLMQNDYAPRNTREIKVVQELATKTIERMKMLVKLLRQDSRGD